ISIIKLIINRCKSHNPNFFFSSRRRHTRFSRDWSSDVCSSDLATSASRRACSRFGHQLSLPQRGAAPAASSVGFGRLQVLSAARSEERRVGKESRNLWSVVYKI